MGKVFTGFVLGVCCLALLYLLINVKVHEPQGVQFSVEPVTVPVIIDEVRTFQSEPTYPVQPILPELGGGGGGGSGSSKEASDTIHHEGIELLKDRPEGEGRNR